MFLDTANIIIDYFEKGMQILYFELKCVYLWFELSLKLMMIITEHLEKYCMTLIFRVTFSR